MNAPVKCSCGCDEWTDKKAVYRNVYRTTVCETCIEWMEQPSEGTDYVCAAYTYNRFICMLDLYKKKKGTGEKKDWELLLYKCRQLLFWVRYTTRLLNSKIPDVHGFQILQLINRSLSVCHTYVMLLWQPKAIFLCFPFHNTHLQAVNLFCSYKWGTSLDMVTNPGHIGSYRWLNQKLALFNISLSCTPEKLPLKCISYALKASTVVSRF